MARSVRNPKIDRPSARARLKVRREPHWTSITPGSALGYRKGKTGGSWIARRYDPAAAPKLRYHAIGPADDVMTADGVAALSFAQAQERAREWFSEAAHKAKGIEPEAAGPYTVGDAIDGYMEWMTADVRSGERSEASEREARYRADAFKKQLGNIEVRSLTSARLREWLTSYAEAPRRVRVKKGAAERFLAAPVTDDEKRARRATANRAWAVLRAALNHAFREKPQLVPSDAAWRSVRPFRKVTRARADYLTVDEARRLINASPEDFRRMVTAALQTGARYGELCALDVDDFDPDAGTLTIRQSKSGKPRHVFLTSEGRAFFDGITAGRDRKEPLLTKLDGARWRSCDQARPMRAAVTAAVIGRPFGFHGLRHTYASLFVMNGAPLHVVAQNLGHADTRMVEVHYSHLSPDYVAETIRRTAPEFGIASGGKVVKMKRRRTPYK